MSTTPQLPKLNVIKATNYKNLKRTEKNNAYVVIKDSLTPRKQDITIYDVTESEILGINVQGIFAILNGAVPPQHDWTKHIYTLGIGNNLSQEIDYSETYKSQSNLIAEMQNYMLELALNNQLPGKYAFATDITNKYAWAFKEMNKSVEDINAVIQQFEEDDNKDWERTSTAKSTASVASVATTFYNEYKKFMVIPESEGTPAAPTAPTAAAPTPTAAPKHSSL